ncbi:lysozyme inhibitor LprI family protein [Chitinophaga vietnamensis]|uniref:lysozyme inhibitor LprI family protein n=1 Tax=Chitinophaga vietnamensis TaxID=2593957 RepID=UPI001177377B|nr:lysozyme inhibitor LprI family protein [Chitinophaga vietnamensis]
MKSLILCLALLAASIAGFAQSQGDMSKQAAQEYKEADKKLNTIYQAILKDYAANKKFITNLKEAQRLWVQLRDAQVKTMYPEAASTYGSVFPMCKANYLTELTQQRIEALQVWLSGRKEGDACNGSVGVKQ